MIDFVQIFEDLDRIQAKIDRITAKKKRVEQFRSDKLKLLYDACMPVCLKAVEAYNKDRSLKIMPDRVEISFGRDNATLSFSVRMRYPTGVEPDEEFDHNDSDKLQSELKPLVDKELQEALIPLVFDKVGLPIHYYSK